MAISGSSKDCEALTLQDVARETAKDKGVLELAGMIRSGIVEDQGSWPETIKKYYRERKNVI